MLDKSSQLLLRHQVITPATLLVNAQDALAHEERCKAHFYYLNLFEQYGDAQDSFAPELTAAHFTQDIEQAVLYIAKEKTLCRMLFDNLAAVMPPAMPLYLVGSNKSGIKSVIKQLPAGFGPPLKVASGNHCVLYMTTRTEVTVAEFNLHNYLSHYPLPTQSTTQVFNLPGVFSEQRLDAGTGLLLEYLAEAAERIQGEILDFACGSGVISAFARAHCPISCVLATDISAFALTAAEMTLRTQQAEATYAVRGSDGLNAISERFDWVITNPPFHSGQRTDYEIARQFIQAVTRRLKPGGQLLMVANSFLGYNELLSERFMQVDELRNNRRFKILYARSPR